MGCKQCSKKILKGPRPIHMLYMHSAKPFPRYKISLYGIDANTTEEENPTFTEFIFFGQQGSIIIGKEADYLLEETRAQIEGTSREISDLVGKRFIVTMRPDDNTLTSDPLPLASKSHGTCSQCRIASPPPTTQFCTSRFNWPILFTTSRRNLLLRK